MIFTFFREAIGTVIPKDYSKSRVIDSSTSLYVEDNSFTDVPYFIKVTTITNAVNYGITESVGIDPGSFSIELSVSLYKNNIKINDIMITDISDRAYIVDSIVISPNTGTVSINGSGAISLLKRRVCASRYMSNLMDTLNPDVKYDALSLIDFAIQKECPTCYGNPPHMDMNFNKNSIGDKNSFRLSNESHLSQIFPIKNDACNDSYSRWMNNLGALPSPRSLLIDWRNPYFNLGYLKPESSTSLERLIFSEPREMPFQSAKLKIRYTEQYTDRFNPGNPLIERVIQENVLRNNSTVEENYITDTPSLSSNSALSLAKKYNSEKDITLLTGLNESNNDEFIHPFIQNYNRGCRIQNSYKMRMFCTEYIGSAADINKQFMNDDPFPIRYLYNSSGEIVSSTEDKVDSFSDLIIGWQYGIGIGDSSSGYINRVDVEIYDSHHVSREGSGIFRMHKTLTGNERYYATYNLWSYISNFYEPHSLNEDDNTENVSDYPSWPNTLVWGLNEINYVRIKLTDNNGNVYDSGDIRIIVSSDGHTPDIESNYSYPDQGALYFPSVNGKQCTDILTIVDVDKKLFTYEEVNGVPIRKRLQIDYIWESTDSSEGSYTDTIFFYDNGSNNIKNYDTISGSINKYPFSRSSSETIKDYVTEWLPNACDFTLDLSQAIPNKDNKYYYITDTIRPIKTKASSLFRKTSGDSYSDIITDNDWNENLLHDRFFLKIRNDDGSKKNMSYPLGTTLYDWIESLYNVIELDTWKAKLNRGYSSLIIKPNIYMSLTPDNLFEVTLNSNDDPVTYYTLHMIYDIPYTRIHSSLFTDLSTNKIYNKVNYTFSNSQSYNVYMKPNSSTCSYLMNEVVDKYEKTFGNKGWLTSKNFEYYNDGATVDDKQAEPIPSVQDLFYIPGYEFEIRSPIELTKYNSTLNRKAELNINEAEDMLSERILPFKIKYRWWIKDKYNYLSDVSDPLCLTRVTTGRYGPIHDTRIEHGSNIVVTGRKAMNLPKNMIVSMDKGMRWLNRMETTSEPTLIANELTVTLETSKHFLNQCIKDRYTGNPLDSIDSQLQYDDYSWNLGDVFKLEDSAYDIYNYACKIISTSYISSAEGDVIDLKIDTYKTLNNVYRDHAQYRDNYIDTFDTNKEPILFENSIQEDAQETIYNIQNW